MCLYFLSFMQNITIKLVHVQIWIYSVAKLYDSGHSRSKKKTALPVMFGIFYFLFCKNRDFVAVVVVVGVVGSIE